LNPESQPPPGDDTAAIADGLEHSLDPRAVTVARLSGAVAVAVLALLNLIWIVPFLFLGSPGTIGFLLVIFGWLFLVAALAVTTYVWPAARHRHASYRVDEQGIRIRTGVWWRSMTSVPRSRVQHTDVSQGPIERSFGLATLVIHTAGTQAASVSLKGLAEGVAHEIRNYLIGGGTDDAV